jgi:tetratricopeptide (TPR) repeat protein
MTEGRQASTANRSGRIRRPKSRRLTAARRRGCLLTAAVLCVAFVRAVAAAPEPSEREATTALTTAQEAYNAAKARYETNATDNAIAWHFACACFDRADAAPTDAGRAAVAQEGIRVCRRLLRQAPELAAAHYYLAMNLGQLARTKTVGALSLVKEMEREWAAARALDRHFDFAGPDRNLGLLFRDAPGVPFSVGSRLKAEQHMQQAVELNPDYPENYLNLIETHLKFKQWEEAAAEDQKLRASLPAARKKLSGPHWLDAWEDWDMRQRSILARLRSHVWKPGGRPVPPLDD